MDINNTMNASNNTVTPNATATNPAVASKKIEDSRTFKKLEANTISVPVAGTFNAVLVGTAFIGTYTRKFTKGTEVNTKDYQYLGLTFKYIDQNTNSVQIIHSECNLTYTDGSKLRTYIEALDPNFSEGAPLKELLGKQCNITVSHKLGTDREGKEKTYANITALVEFNPNMPAVEVADNELQYFDILDDMNNIEDGLNQKHRWLILNRSHEYGSNPMSVDSPVQQPSTQEQSPQYQHPPIQEQPPQYEQPPF